MRLGHLTYPLLPVVGTPEREEGWTMREQEVGHSSGLAEQEQMDSQANRTPQITRYEDMASAAMG